MDDLSVEPISYSMARGFVAAYHYAVVMPGKTELSFGLFRKQLLVGVMTWGYGLRPAHTIKIMFPSLIMKDYLELGRLCVLDSEPRNTESWFIARACEWIKQNLGSIKVLFSWADGIRGKPGYVYQASNFLYGGFIWTDCYITQDGERVHARQFQTVAQLGRTEGLKCGRRPNADECARRGWRQVFGKQFRYVKLLCSRKERRELLRQSPFKWGTQYPKAKDCEWRERAGQGSRVNCEAPSFTSAVRFRSPAPLFDS